MSQPGEPRGPGDGGAKDQGEGLLPQSSSLIMLLLFFALTAAITLVSIMTHSQDPGEGHVLPTRAYGPGDHPEVGFDVQLLDQLKAGQGAKGEGETFMVPPPPFEDEDNFPCSMCHEDMETDPTPRELEYHEEIQLNHGPKTRWCLDCHNPDDRDTLRLINGKTIGFDEHYQLCGQCHGTIFRDWREGIHGRRRGYWNGAKSYLLCAHCHNPHHPHFEPLEPLPPPVHPSYLASDMRQALAKAADAPAEEQGESDDQQAH